LLLGVVLPFVGGRWSPLVAVGLFLAVWLALATFIAVAERLRMASAQGWRRIAQPPLGWWGMHMAHLGVAVFVAGVTVVRAYETESNVHMAPGSVVAVGSQLLRFDGVAPSAGQNYETQRGRFELLRDGRPVATLHPEKRTYVSMPATPITEAAIASSWLGDVYVSLGAPTEQGAWTVSAYHKPLVTWIWGGCALMALGGVFALLDRRYRLARRPAELPAGVVPGG
jgi:cytochrome c-type biogenesis protein CcmF